MNAPTHKGKLNLSIAEDVLEKANRKQKKTHTASGLIENFLSFFVNPRYIASNAEKNSKPEESNSAQMRMANLLKMQHLQMRIRRRTAIAIFPHEKSL